MTDVGTMEAKVNSLKSQKKVSLQSEACQAERNIYIFFI